MSDWKELEGAHSTAQNEMEGCGMSEHSERIQKLEGTERFRMNNRRDA